MQKSTLQARMGKDIEQMKKSRKMWVREDKSRSIHKISSSEYERILNNKIPYSYKIDYRNTPALINRDADRVIGKLQVKDRQGKLIEKGAYIWYKDHKQNFEDRKQASLINPTKT